MPDEVITAAAGLVASFLSGLLGIGGGLVLTPLLLYLPPLLGGVAIPVKIVTGLTIVQAISGSLLGAIRHRSYGNVSDRVLLLIFAVMAFAGAVMLLLPVSPREGDAQTIAVRRPLAVAIAVVLGFFGGMVGIGGIAFIIAALVYILRVPARLAIGTSLGIGLFAAVAALIGKTATAQIDPPLAAIVF